MISENNLAGYIGATVFDRDGDKIGSLEQIYVDPMTGRPNWAAVRTGLFGMSHTFVPLDEAEEQGEHIRVPFEKAFVKDAPRIDHDAELSQDEEQALYDYYRSPETVVVEEEYEATIADARAAHPEPDAYGSPGTDAEHREDAGDRPVAAEHADGEAGALRVPRVHRLRKHVATDRAVDAHAGHADTPAGKHSDLADDEGAARV